MANCAPLVPCIDSFCALVTWLPLVMRPGTLYATASWLGALALIGGLLAVELRTGLLPLTGAGELLVGEPGLEEGKGASGFEVCGSGEVRRGERREGDQDGVRDRFACGECGLEGREVRGTGEMGGDPSQGGGE